jgi:hypothetical protein
MSVSLNDLCRWEGLQRLDYLKIDAEGAESAILQGGAGVLANFRPIVQVETTKNDSRWPDGYRRFRAQGSPNDVFIPEGTNHPRSSSLRLKISQPLRHGAVGARAICFSSFDSIPGLLRAERNRKACSKAFREEGFWNNEILE